MRLLPILLLSACGGSTARPCPDGMVSIPAGTVVLGERNPHQAWHQPARSIDLPAYCIDVYEYPDREGALPRSNVSWEEAQASCESAGKRLCTSDEWERACRGTSERLYGYGNQRDPAACNTPIEGSGPGPGTPAPLAASGSFARCHTPEGVYDLNGNLSEWVADPWAGAPEPFNLQAKVDPASWRTLRGGTMWSHTFYGQDCTSAHGHDKSGFRNMDDGLRCCLTP